MMRSLPCTEPIPTDNAKVCNRAVYTSYAGSGGILLDSLWRRAQFA